MEAGCGTIVPGWIKEASEICGTSAVLSGLLTMSLRVKAMSYRNLIEVIRRPAPQAVLTEGPARYRRRF